LLILFVSLNNLLTNNTKQNVLGYSTNMSCEGYPIYHDHFFMVGTGVTNRFGFIAGDTQF